MMPRASRYDCDCDLVIEMQDRGVGVEEVLQYARGVFSRDQVRSLLFGLREMQEAPRPAILREPHDVAR